MHNCEKCGFSAKYDDNNKSFLGRIWKWHINLCPGWKKYITSLSDHDRKVLAEKYGLKKYQ
jgi:hypothetical protein